MRRIYIYFLFLFILIPATMWGQTQKITGTVRSAEDDSPLPGVTIQLKGSGTGTTTDLNGKYTLDATPGSFLVFSFIGMESQEVEVGKKIILNISLKPKSIALGELVIVGYSSDSKKLISGSVAVVGSEQIRDIPIKTIDNVLQGKSAGMQISQNSGTPGGGMSVTLRGSSSINAGSQPLFVVDGIPINTSKAQQIGFGGQNVSGLTDLAPNEIETVTVLKDASATAIYGARASNGVILITTKKGALKKPVVEMTMDYGISALPKERKLKMLNAEQWNDYKGILNGSTAVDNDWIDLVTRKAPTSNFELNISGGDAITKYFISGSVFNQDGIVRATAYYRQNGRLNFETKLTDKFKIGVNVGLSNSKNKRVEGDDSVNGPLPNAISEPPVIPVYDADGNYDESGPYANPVAIYKEATNDAFTFRTIGNIFAEYANIIPGLNFVSKWGIDAYSFREHSFDPPLTRQGARYNGIGIEANTNVSNTVGSQVFNYNRDIGTSGNLSALLGYSFEMYKRKVSYIDGIDFPDRRLEYLVSAGTIREARATSLARGMQSFFGQFKYDLNHKYIITATGRSDGSSKFGKNHRYGYFPAGSVAWRMSEEKWMKQFKWLDEFKVRASVGLTGNDGIPDFQSLGLYGGNANYGGQSGIYPSQLPNDNLKWETTTQRNIGLDFSFLKERFGITIDIYSNKTKDLLLDRPVSLTSGYASIMDNIGELENKGFEFTLTSQNLRKAVKWSTNLNFSVARNKVTKLYNDQPIIISSWGNSRIVVGEPIGIFWAHNSLGVDPSSGDIVFEDVNNDGLITADDMKKVGSPHPDFTSGMTNTFEYGNWEMSIFLHLVYGNEVYNSPRMWIEAMKGSDNQTTEIIRRWRQPGDITDIPRVTETDPNNNNRPSSRFIEDGSFLRVKNVSVSYRFNPDILKKIHVSYARVYVSVQNLFTFTKYTGMDPEVNYAGTDNLVLGTDFFTFPQARGFTAGLNLRF